MNAVDAAGSGLRCVLVDDDLDLLALGRRFLEHAGWAVEMHADPEGVLEALLADPPDCVLLDIMMPGVDGLELLTRIRAQSQLDKVRVVILSSKLYEFDRRKAFSLGADGYLKKSMDLADLNRELGQIVFDKPAVKFWGVHGTLPVPGPRTVRYGGNTSCVTVRFSRDQLFVFDAGTGIKGLSNLMMQTKDQQKQATVFISHSHWDHINALPFFSPLYVAGNNFQICGPAQGAVTVRDMISAQMDAVYFPITIDQFAANIQYLDLKEGAYEFDGVRVETLLLNHPGYCLGYRLNCNGLSICYVTDNELVPRSSPEYNAGYRERLTRFVGSADILITDCTYFDAEYPTKVGWGHSCIGEVADLAAAAYVKRLFLFHHDPDHGDDDIDLKLELTQARLAALGSQTECVAPAEGEEYLLDVAIACR